MPDACDQAVDVSAINSGELAVDIDARGNEILHPVPARQFEIIEQEARNSGDGERVIEVLLARLDHESEPAGKVALLRDRLLASGQATPDQWSRVHSPIGLDLGALTAPEIAASIVAELVAVRRRGFSPRLWQPSP